MQVEDLKNTKIVYEKYIEYLLEIIKGKQTNNLFESN